MNGSRCLLQAMNSHGCHTLVFSSSATLYGYRHRSHPETAPIAPINPTATRRRRWVDAGRPPDPCIGQLADRLPALFQPRWRPSLRTHRGGSRGIPNNLFPFVSQVAVGHRPTLQVFGGDWPARWHRRAGLHPRDGSCGRAPLRPRLPYGGRTAAAYPQSW